MGRPKLIEDQTLLELIKKFYYEECHGDAKKLKLPKITEYINKNGYPNYPVTTLRRTSIAVAYIEEMKKIANDSHYVAVSAYQTIDAAAFVDTNRSRDMLIKGISERDGYYKTVADSALHAFEKLDQLQQQLDEEKKANTMLNGKVAELEELNTKYKAQLRELNAELKASKSVIDTYIYPELANELLVKEGALRKTESPIKEDALKNNLITSTTDIRKTTKSGSNIIKGLFDIRDD
jgi:hypothetical protein